MPLGSIIETNIGELYLCLSASGGKPPFFIKSTPAVLPMPMAMALVIYEASSKSWIIWLTWVSMPSGYRRTIHRRSSIVVMILLITPAWNQNMAPWKISELF